MKDMSLRAKLIIFFQSAIFIMIIYIERKKLC
jgi:hypothetical protein